MCEELARFGKGSNVRTAKSKVVNDARARLQGIIERLVASGMDGRAAEFRAKWANPELWEMACGAPNDSEDLSVDAGNGPVLTDSGFQSPIGKGTFSRSPDGSVTFRK
jgi:hypothetical protein